MARLIESNIPSLWYNTSLAPTVTPFFDVCVHVTHHPRAGYRVTTVVFPLFPNVYGLYSKQEIISEKLGTFCTALALVSDDFLCGYSMKGNISRDIGELGCVLVSCRRLAVAESRRFLS